MPVTDFECQIARGQIGRYLGGGALSPEAMRGLEDHLAECPGCKTLVSDRRAALMGMLGGDIPTRAVVSMPVVEEENPLVAALKAKEKSVKPEIEEAKPKAAPRYAKAENPTAKPVLTKPILLGGLLAIVLLGMNFMSRANNGKGAFGGRAADSFASESLASKPAATPETKLTEAVTPVVPPVTAPVTTPAPKPTVVTNADSVQIPKATPDAIKTEALKIQSPKVEAPKTEAVKPIAPKAAAEVKAVVPKPAAQKPAAPKPVEKPIVKPVAPEHVVKKIVRRTAAHKRVVRKARVKRAPRTSVRVYGLDGHPLK